MRKNKMNNLKITVMLVLSLSIIFSIYNIVLAENSTDADFDSIIQSSNDTNENTAFENATEKNVVNTTNNTSNNVTNNTSKNIITTVNSTNNNTKTTNTLAKTGIGDTNSIIALIVIVSGIVAIYSYKKMNDYKKL